MPRILGLRLRSEARGARLRPGSDVEGHARASQALHEGLTHAGSTGEYTGGIWQLVAVFDQ